MDAEGQPISPTRRYFDYHPTYNALRRVLVDGQVMEEHHKFYYKAMTISSGPFQGKACRLISPGQQDGFKPFPSFMRNGQEIDKWYCGTYAATNEGGSPVKIGSRPGKAPIVSLNFPTMQTYCANRNTGGVSGFGMWDIYQASEIQLLALIEAATPDVQPVFGRGRVDTSSAGAVDATDVSTATWRGHVGMWGNVWQMVDGVSYTSAVRGVTVLVRAFSACISLLLRPGRLPVSVAASQNSNTVNWLLNYCARRRRAIKIFWSGKWTFSFLMTIRRSRFR